MNRNKNNIEKMIEKAPINEFVSSLYFEYKKRKDAKPKIDDREK